MNKSCQKIICSLFLFAFFNTANALTVKQTEEKGSNVLLVETVSSSINVLRNEKHKTEITTIFDKKSNKISNLSIKISSGEIVNADKDVLEKFNSSLNEISHFSKKSGWCEVESVLVNFDSLTHPDPSIDIVFVTSCGKVMISYHINDGEWTVVWSLE